MIIKSQDFTKLAQMLNHTAISNQLGISSIEAGNDCLKWYSPSIEYPSLLNVYHLYGPFTVTNTSRPQIFVTESTGEKDYLIDQVRLQLLEIIISHPQIFGNYI